MAFAIVLTLDPASAAPVRALWQRLAKAGMRVMADLGVDPHLSLAVWEALDVERAAAAVTALAGETAPVAVTFTEVRAFGGEAVYLWPAPSPRLAELQARVQARLAPLGVGASAHYAAAAWVPHCTLAMDLDLTGAATARALAAAELALPLGGRLERMALVEFRPVRQRLSRPLTGR